MAEISRRTFQAGALGALAAGQLLRGEKAMAATTDLTGGNDTDIEFTAGSTPTDPAYREGINVWIWDDAGRICFPRMGIESVGAKWDTARTLMFNCAMPDGRILTAWEDHAPHSAFNAVGKPTVIGAGPMRFECIEPYVRWKVSFDGKLEETSLQRQQAGEGPGCMGTANRTPGTVPFAYDLDLVSLHPPHYQGTAGGTGYVPGENRFEQLFRATGTVTLDGKTQPFSGGGNRIRRKGGNRTPHGDFFGHVWLTAWFPSGRAFGVLHYYPRPDGTPKFCEAWVTGKDGRRLPAEVIDRPWLQSCRVHNDTYSFLLRTAEGDHRITARSHASAYRHQDTTFPNIQQGIEQYMWDSEEAFGMAERSTSSYPGTSWK